MRQTKGDLRSALLPLDALKLASNTTISGDAITGFQAVEAQ